MKQADVIPLDLQRATNLFGRLQPEVKDRVVKYLNGPTESGWAEIHGILISPRITIWQAVIRVDPTFPKTGRRMGAGGKIIERWS